MTPGGTDPPGDRPPGSAAWDGDAYQQRFDDLAAAGVDVHGEADCVVRLGSRSVLDAGCGTGRVAAELARRGFDVTGIDRDPSMIATARSVAPGVGFEVGDVADVQLGRTFDLVVMAGNVPLFTPDGTQGELVAGCVRHLAVGGRLLTGFSVDRGYTVADYDRDCRAAGLGLLERWATWDGESFGLGSTYAVSLHHRTG